MKVEKKTFSERREKENDRRKKSHLGREATNKYITPDLGR